MKSLLEFYIAPTWTPFKIFNVYIYISELKLRWMTFCDYFMIFVFKCSFLIQLRLNCIIVLKCRVVAKKMFSQLRFSLSQSLFLMRDLEQILWAQSFGTPWMQGYQTLCLQDDRCSTWKENMRNMCSKQDFISKFCSFILLIVVPILEVVLSSCTSSKKLIQKTKQYATANQWLVNKERTIIMVIPLWNGTPGQNPQDSQELIPNFLITCRQFDIKECKTSSYFTSN